MFQELDKQHELEKAIIINETEKKLQHVTNVFNYNLAVIEKSMEQNWK